MLAVHIREGENMPEMEHEAVENVLPDDDGLSITTFEKWLLEIQQQPTWRRQADIEADYYDGNQLDSETLTAMQELGIAPMIDNEIKPVIDTVLGTQAKTRTDWVVKADGSAMVDASEALTAKMKEAERESRADRACSDAFADQAKIGLGWVEVAREHDPFKYKFRCQPVHRREIWWDWLDRTPDLSDAKYLVRRRWHATEEVAAAFPDKAELIRTIGAGWPMWETLSLDQSISLDMSRSYNIERDTTIFEAEWRNIQRDMLGVYEVWYRKLVTGYAARLPTGGVMEVDMENERHIAAIAAGVVKPVKTTYKKMRLAWFVGPHKITEIPSPYQHNSFPYVPFFGFREDLTAVPYGMIRSMMSPQDEVNARKSKAMWLLSSKRVITDEDAVVDHNLTREEVSRPDAYIVLSKDRRPSSRFEVDDGTPLAETQFKAMQMAKEGIQRNSGVYQAMLGREEKAKSGIAIQSLLEQGNTTLAELMDNFNFARQRVGELLFELVKEDIGTDEVPVMTGSGMTKKEIVLNQRVQNPDTGEIEIINRVANTKFKVALADVPSTVTYRQQQLAQLSEMVKSLPPQLQAVAAPHVFEATDLPNREVIANEMRQALGMPVKGPGAPGMPEGQMPDGQMPPVDPNAPQDGQQMVLPPGVDPNMPQHGQQVALPPGVDPNSPVPPDIQQRIAEYEQALQQRDQALAEMQAKLQDKDADIQDRAMERQAEVEKFHAMAQAIQGRDDDGNTLSIVMQMINQGMAQINESLSGKIEQATQASIQRTTEALTGISEAVDHTMQALLEDEGKDDEAIAKVMGAIEQGHDKILTAVKEDAAEDKTEDRADKAQEPDADDRPKQIKVQRDDTGEMTGAEIVGTGKRIVIRRDEDGNMIGAEVVADV